ncbi:MAG: hypothetical protein PHG03_05460 [Bacilli bacterium]|nr:hypothetical protein [Bacilli bacterium]MDD4795981.1 hypothetical protein [Bacilli bacterium]
MISKVKNYYGVIVFYFLLILLLVLVSYQNKMIDMRATSNSLIKADR